MPTGMSAARRFPRTVIDRGLVIATFVAGSGGALLMLDAHDLLGLYSALLALVLRLVHARWTGRSAVSAALSS
jgi:hypothetical protein